MAEPFSDYIAGRPVATDSIRATDGVVVFRDGRLSLVHTTVVADVESMLNGLSDITFSSEGVTVFSINIAATIAAAGSDYQIVAYSTDQTVSENLTVPTNIELLPLNGAVINVATGKTLTYLGNTTRWPLAQIFGGAGAVVGLRYFRPEWWGAVADGATDCYPAFFSMSQAVTASGKGTVELSPGDYLFDRYKIQTAYQSDIDPEVINPNCAYVGCNGLKITGYGAKITLKGDVELTADYVAGDYGYPDKKMITPFLMQACDNLLLEGFEMDGNAGSLTMGEGANAESSRALIELEGCANVVARNLVLHHSWNDNIRVRRYNGPDIVPYEQRIACRNVSMENIVSYGAARCNMAGFEIRDWTVRNCRFYDAGYTGGPVWYSPASNFAVEPDPITIDIGATSFILLENCDLRNARLRNAYSNVRQGRVKWSHCYFDNPSGDQQPCIMSTPYGVIEDCEFHLGVGRIDVAISGTLPGYNVVRVVGGEIHATSGEGLFAISQDTRLSKLHVQGVRFINDGGTPLTKSFPNIENGYSAIDVTFRDNYIFIPASAYKAEGTGQHVVCSINANLAENNIYETDLNDDAKFFAAFFQSGDAPKDNVVVRNERFISPNNLSFRPADNASHDMTRPFGMGDYIYAKTKADDGDVILPYSASIDTDASKGTVFKVTVTDGNNFTMNNPTKPVIGQHISYLFSNTSGGATGTITWGSAFKVPTPANGPSAGQSHFRSFRYDGNGHWLMTFVSSLIPN